MRLSHRVTTSDIFQKCFDRLIAWPAGGAFHDLSYALLRRVFQFAGARCHQAVAYSVDGCRIYFPASHDTPFQWKRNPEYSKSLGRVAAACARKHPQSLIVDLGANVGDTAAIMRSRGVENTILAVEGAEEFFDVLSVNAPLLGGVVPIRRFVGAAPGRATASLHVMQSGNAVVSENGTWHGGRSAPGEERQIDFVTLDAIVDEHAAGQRVGLLKTDIEGYDLPVLNECLPLLARHKPLIHLELHVSDIDEANTGVSWRDVWSNLQAVGYQSALYWYHSSDFLCRLNLDRDHAIVEDIHNHIRNRGGHLYVDVCLAHDDDADLVDAIHEQETAHSLEVRGGAALLV